MGRGGRVVYCGVAMQCNRARVRILVGTKNNLNLQLKKRWAVVEIVNAYLLLVSHMLKYAFGYCF